ncbi:hypothetical protein CERSUDRAFT_79615 [Gelatoporia subvermispora B]|uniref:Protein byr4 n=1 Tax=Ceriporiopsis subvermispora (strain B) TaxID=914234 RepID=M2QY13_CERS8|nr:hypothetical protein CERSUDRAFT_79615 [Gelatoporia subvermispora B]
MNTIPAPSIVLSREEWPDADFDLPDGEPIHASDAESDKDDGGLDEDWDLEMDLGKTGTARTALPLIHNLRQPSPSIMPPQVFTIRPPLHDSPIEDDDEGVSTIKVAAFLAAPSKVAAKRPPSPVDEDFEDGFALPDDLTQLSLRPSSLAHRSSKASIEWGDRDQTVSSQSSSDTYSTFGFADHSPSSNYTSASLPESETEEDEDEGELDGLVIPTGLFESGHGAKKLTKILEKKKATFADDQVKVVSPDPEDDFEIGLIIDNDVELSPSRLIQHTQTIKHSASGFIRSKSVPPRPPASIRPPSRLRNDRAKEPSNPPVSSAQQFRKLNQPPSPPARPATVRVQTYSQALTSNPPPPSPSFLTPKPGSLRVQKSHSGLKPSSSPPSTRNLGRKASLPSLSESTQAQASASGSGFAAGNVPGARYDAPTASSRAKTHTNSASRVYALDYNVPPARPSTPSSNPAALRLTLPTSSFRMKSRAPISAVFPQTIAPVVPPIGRSVSPLPTPRPPSSASSKPPSRSGHVQTQSLPSQSAVKVLKRPKRQRTYGDGTELDGFDDLPLDRDKEGRYRTQPKGAGVRIPGGSYPKQGDAAFGKGTLRKKGKREPSFGAMDAPKPAAPTAKTLKRTGRIEFSAKSSEPAAELPKARDGDAPTKKRKAPAQASGPTRRKPTLIRNLGGASAPKVVGDMKWNPTTLRWEGNDQVLRDFDAAVGTSTRPALITHLTGSSIGSPVGSFAAGARVVGNMIFDPSRMCWISTLSPEEDEPDVFADLADDEDEDWEAKASTIRASQQLQSTSAAPPDTSSSTESRTPTSPSRKHTRSHSETESDRCSRASMVCDIDDTFVDVCREAEQRHRAELKGWILSPSAAAQDEQLDRTYLYEIRALATRQY